MKVVYFLPFFFLQFSWAKDEVFRIALKSANNAENGLNFGQGNQPKGKNVNANYSPFDVLRPEVWQFNAFVGKPLNAKQRGQIVLFSLEIDSGDTWIRQNVYSGVGSTTFVANKSKTFELNDLFGKVQGYVGQDDMNLIGSDYIFSAQQFGLIVNDAHYSPTWQTSGKLGLAWPGAGSAILNGSLINSLEPLKSFTISFDQEDKMASYALFGEANCQDCLDFWATVPLRGELEYWQISLLGFELDDHKMTNIPIGSGHQLAMLSNRVQFIYGQESYIEKLASNLGGIRQKDGNGRIWYSVECSKKDDLPYILLNLENDQYLAISSKDYVKQLNRNVCVLLFAPIEKIQSEFYAGKVSWIIGLPVLRRYCQLYDIENKEIGFARAQIFDFSK